MIADNVSDVEGYVLAMAYASTVKGEGRKDKIVAYIETLGLSEHDRTWILASLGYSDEKKTVAAELKKSGATEAEMSILGLSAA